MTPDIRSASERRSAEIEKLGAPNFSLTPLPVVAVPGFRVRANERGDAAVRTSGASARLPRVGKLGAPNSSTSGLSEALISLARKRPVGSSQLLRSRLAQQPGGHS